MQSKGQRHRFNRTHLSGSAAYFFYSYFLNNILPQEGARAYWSLLFNLLFAPSLHQLSLLSLFAKISVTLFFPHTDLILYIFTSASFVNQLFHGNLL